MPFGHCLSGARLSTGKGAPFLVHLRMNIDFVKRTKPQVYLRATVAPMVLLLVASGGCAKPKLRPTPATTASAAGLSSVTPAELASHATIRRDRFGVPHILADSEEAAAFAQGFATAEDYGPDLARLFLRARGTLASVFGEAFVEEDTRTRSLGIHEIAAARFGGLPPFMQAILNGYAAGYNTFLAGHRAALPDWAAPVTGVDVLAHSRAVLLLDFALDLRLWANSPASNTGSNAGSNAWAIGRPLSRSGGGMLLANPHLPWDGSMRFHEVQLTVPGIINVSGATFIGLPVVVIGFNESLGWSHTVNTVDSDDLYELTLDPSGTAYAYDRGWLPLTSRTIDIAVKTDHGLETRKRTVQTTHYGPVTRSAEKVLALKSANLNNVNFLTQWNEMGKATSLNAFTAAVNLRQLPMFNLVYADREGNVWYLFNGRIPLRPAGYDWSGIVPGNTSKTEWFVVRPLSDLPQLLNPKSGYVQNCNDAPWYTNLEQPLEPARFSTYITANTFGWRSQLSLRILSHERDMTLDGLKAYKFNAEAPFAEAVTGDLIALARAQGDPNLREGAAVLEAWDKQTNADSRGAVLYMAWFGQYFQSTESPFQRPWSATDPAHTPSGLGDPATALVAFDSAVTAVKQAYSSLAIAWGETHRLKRGDLDLPLRGTELTFNSVMYRPTPQNIFLATGGDSYVLAVEFTPSGPHAYSVVAYSESSNPQSAHFTDQSRLYATQQYKTAWFTESDIKANEEREYRPNR